VFFNRNLTLSTKVAVYKAICLSILLYGCPLPPEYPRHSFVAQKETYRNTYTPKIESVELLVLQRQLLWLGHVIRMPSNRLPRRLLYGELQLGQRPVGRPKLRYSDQIKSVLRKCNIPESQLEALAEDRVLWSLTCATDLKNLAAVAEQAASDRRARRRAAATATPAGPVCPYRGKIFASDFGLRSHLRVHL